MVKSWYHSGFDLHNALQKSCHFYLIPRNHICNQIHSNAKQMMDPGMAKIIQLTKLMPDDSIPTLWKTLKVKESNELVCFRIHFFYYFIHEIVALLKKSLNIYLYLYKWFQNWKRKRYRGGVETSQQVKRPTFQNLKSSLHKAFSWME